MIGRTLCVDSTFYQFLICTLLCFFLSFLMAASVSASSVLIVLSLCLSAGNSKQALRCKTCKMAAHLWCTSELSQQLCHGKVRIHTKNDCNGGRFSCLGLLSLICNMLIDCFFNLAASIALSIHCCGVFAWHLTSDSKGDYVIFFFFTLISCLRSLCVILYLSVYQ